MRALTKKQKGLLRSYVKETNVADFYDLNQEQFCEVLRERDYPNIKDDIDKYINEVIYEKIN